MTVRSKLTFLVAFGVLISMQFAPALASKKDDTLNIAWREELPSYDPYFASPRESVLLARLVWDNLIDRDPVTLEYKPLLAKSYKWLNDTAIELELRQGIKFHNGQPFTADDVVYTLNKVSNPEYRVINPKMVNWIKNAEKIDPYKVVIHLKAPFPAALEYLAAAIPILPHEYHAKVGPEGMSKNPVGTGPYRVAESVPGRTITFIKNVDYFKDSPKGQPQIGKIVQRTIPDPQTQVAELLSGRVDWIWQVAPDIGDRLKSRPNITVLAGETMRFAYLSMDATGRSGTDVFKDVRVRQAVNYAINREAIVAKLVGGASRVLNAACYPSQFGCDENVRAYEYNPEKAKQLLAEAGYPDGFNVEIYSYRDRPVTEAIIGDLRSVGIRAKLTTTRFATFKELASQTKLQLRHATFGSWSISDVSIVMEGFFQGVDEDNSQDKDVIAWTKEAGRLIDADKRKELYSKALKRIADQAYWAPLHTYGVLYAFSSDLDFKSNPDEVARFYNAKWK